MLGGIDITIPDSITPAVGWRAWNVSGEAFSSPHMHTPWPKGRLQWDKMCRCGHVARNSSAYERLMELLPAYAPYFQSMSHECLCGVNAFKHRHQLASQLRYMHQTDAVGQVQLSGEVRLYELGYRAESGRIDRVWATSYRPRKRAAVKAAAEAAEVQFMGTVPVALWMLAALWAWLVRPTKGRYRPLHTAVPVAIAAAGFMLAVIERNGFSPPHLLIAPMLIIMVPIQLAYLIEDARRVRR